MNIASIALSGLRATDARLAVAADNIVHATTPDYREKNIVQTAQEDGGVNVDVVEGKDGVSLEEQVVELDLATYNFQANLKVLQTERANEKKLLDIQA